MGVYTKSKANFTNLDVSTHAKGEDAFRVGIAENSMNIVIDYLTNLYANPAKAVIRELFTNAADAVKLAKSKQIVISLKDNTLTVTDYGIGMSAEQLRNNYVTYANSSKTQDFDSVGSFGLGSKSPMAIAPSFTVVSNNGSEENSVIVYRKQDGLFAEIAPVEDKKSYSFTRVTVENIKDRDAETIDSYIIENILPYSSDSYDIIYTSDLSRPEDQVTMKSVRASRRLADGTSIEYTIYYKDLFTSFVYNDKVYPLVRVNGSVCYPLKSEWSYYDYDRRIPEVTVVIEVESGFFSFAPAREELPACDAKEYLRSFANNLSLLSLLKDVARFGDENKDSVLFASMVARKGRMVAYRKVAESLDTKPARYITGVLNETITLDPEYEVYYYGRHNHTKSTRFQRTKSDLKRVVVDTFDAIFRTFPGYDKSYYRIKPGCKNLDYPTVPYCDYVEIGDETDSSFHDHSRIIYLYGLKRNRKGDLKIPPYFSLLSVKNRYGCGRGYRDNPDIFIVCSDKDSAELPEALKPMENLGYIYEGTGGPRREPIEVIDASTYYNVKPSDSGATRNNDRASRKVTFYIDKPTINRNGYCSDSVHVVNTTVGEMAKFADYLVYDPNVSCYTSKAFGLINVLTSASVALAPERLPLYVIEAVAKAGVKIVGFNFTLGKFIPSDREETAKVISYSERLASSNEANAVISTNKWLTELCDWREGGAFYELNRAKEDARIATLRLESQLNRLGCSLGEETLSENELPSVFADSPQFDISNVYFCDLHATLNSDQRERFYSNMSSELFSMVARHCLGVDGGKTARALDAASDYMLNEGFISHFGIDESVFEDFKSKYSDYLSIYHKVEDYGADCELDKICHDTIDSEINSILASI